jgi:hypothetical protein
VIQSPSVDEVTWAWWYGTLEPEPAAVALGQCAPSSERNQMPRVPSGALT